MHLGLNSISNDVRQSQASTHGPVGTQLSELPQNFAHSEIEPRPEGRVFDSLWPYRPEFPEGGLNVDCPHCQQAATYQRFEFLN